MLRAIQRSDGPNARDRALLFLLGGLELGIKSVAFSPDGNRLAGTSDDYTVRLWDITSGVELAVFRGHEGDVGSVAFSPDGTCIASGSRDGTVRVWHVASGAQQAMLREPESMVTTVAFSSAGDRIVSGSIDKTIRVWDATNGTELAVLHGHDLLVTSVAFSPRSDHLASGSQDHTVRPRNSIVLRVASKQKATRPRLRQAEEMGSGARDCLRSAASGIVRTFAARPRVGHGKGTIPACRASIWGAHRWLCLASSSRTPIINHSRSGVEPSGRGRKSLEG